MTTPVTRRTRHCWPAVAIALAGVLGAACTDDSITGPTAPPPEAGDRTFPTSTSTIPDTTTATSDTTATTDTAPTSTAPLGLPPVSTLVPQVPAPLDPNDPNNRFAPPDTPDEIAIITAYIEAADRSNKFTSTFPRDLNDPLILDGPFTAQQIEQELSNGAEDNELRQTLDVSGGITYRPFVADYEPGDTTALVLDCQLDATVWRNADTGEIIPPPNDSYPNTGPDVATATSVVATMVLVDGKWLVESGSGQPGACL
jgi:hypothetical protein